MVQDKIKFLKLRNIRRNRNEMHAIKELEKKKGTVIRPADMGIPQ